jgi:lipopolysaccharide export system protein LptC
MEMTALDGIYDSKGEMLTLGKNIVLTSSTGYEGKLSEAVVDIRKGNIVSKKPVEVKMLQGTLNAEGIEVVNSGEMVRFEGGVNMVLMLHNPPGSGTKTEIKR